MKTIRFLLPIIVLSVLLMGLLGCGTKSDPNVPADGGPTADGGIPADGGNTGLMANCPAATPACKLDTATVALLTNATFGSANGSITAIALGSTPCVVKDLNTTSTDPWVKNCGDNQICIINRYTFDNIEVVDPAQCLASYPAARQWSTGNGSNPIDLWTAAAGNKQVAIVALHDATPTEGLIALDLDNGTILKRIDVSQFKSDTHLPHPGRILSVNDKLFVAMLNYTSGWPAIHGANSYLAVLDPSTQQLLDLNIDGGVTKGITIPGQNPRCLAYHPSVGILVAATGTYGSTAGAIYKVDPATYQVTELISTASLGGQLSELIIASPTKAYAHVGISIDGNFATLVKRFNPTAPAGSVSTVYTLEGFSSALGYDPTSQYLLVGDVPLSGSPVVKIYDTSTTPESLKATLEVTYGPAAFAIFQNR